MKNIFSSKKTLIFIIITQVGSLSSADNLHFYKTPYHNATKSFNNKKWLAIFDTHYANGSTHRGKNNRGNRVQAFDIYGNHNLLYMTSNVPTAPNLSSSLQTIVTNINTKRSSFNTDSCVEFSGKFEVDEFVFNYRQNLIADFFLELNIPIRRLRSNASTYIDNSPSTIKDDTDWTSFLTNLDDIIKGYGFKGYLCGHTKTAFADISLLGGWQHTFSFPTDFLEYIKLSLKGGVLFPTSPERDFSHHFAFETGYNGHTGIPLRTDLLFGLSKDIYIGTYIGFLFFLNKTHDNYPVKTDTKQNGFITLYRTKIHEKKGNLFDFGTYLKLDHFFKGLSALVGYACNIRTNDHLSLANESAQTNNTIINTNNRLDTWHMHVLHMLAEYDLGAHDFFKRRKWQPRFGVFYDYPFRGKRVLSNPMTGGTIGCDLTWNF